jgi:hypothetical protein
MAADHPSDPAAGSGRDDDSMSAPRTPPSTRGSTWSDHSVHGPAWISRRCSTHVRTSAASAHAGVGGERHDKRAQTSGPKTHGPAGATAGMRPYGRYPCRKSRVILTASSAATAPQGSSPSRRRNSFVIFIESRGQVLGRGSAFRLVLPPVSAPVRLLEGRGGQRIRIRRGQRGWSSEPPRRSPPSLARGLGSH